MMDISDSEVKELQENGASGRATWTSWYTAKVPKLSFAWPKLAEAKTRGNFCPTLTLGSDLLLEKSTKPRARKNNGEKDFCKTCG